MLGYTYPWHSLDTKDVREILETNPEGLAHAEAAKRLDRNGPNELPQEEGDPIWKLLLRQFHNPLMYLMLLATAVSLFVGHVTDTIFIIVVMVSNALVGFYQEYKANNALQSLKNYVKLKARVIRGGLEQEILASHIVPGDIIVLRSGDKVPADARIFECRGLRVNEASLTGESLAVEKRPAPVAEDTETGDRTSMVFMGTIVDEGSARAIVVETGLRTQYGDIVKMLKTTPEEATPLQQTVASLSKIVGIFITCVVVFIILNGYIAGLPFGEIFAAALALFVSAIPEGLLPAITIVLTIGMRRIMYHKGLVRRLASTETLGGVTVICTDKTGTLTEGRMEAREILTAHRSDILDGTAHPSPAALEVLRAAVLTSDAYIENPDAQEGELVVRGRPTEQALLKAGVLQGLVKHEVDKEYPTVDTVFFSSDRKYSATLRQSASGEKLLYVMGAPERVTERAVTLRVGEKDVPFDGEAYADLTRRMDALVGKGFRLVACAYRRAGASAQEIESDPTGLTLLGLIALNDPVREQVPQAFAQTKRAGIRTVIVTGDHQLTARAIAEKMGFAIGPGEILEGQQIEEMNDLELSEKIKTTHLFARVSPRHKLRIVQAFQEQGHVVAMFGDGVNDAPALKAANIGVAVNAEVDAAREVADIVLLDSGFNTIVKAIEQGRIIFGNIQRVFYYLITQDFSQFFIFLTSIALGLPLPLITAQLLFVNLVESGLPDLALTTEEDRHGVMDEPPRNPKQSVATRESLKWMAAAFTVSGGIAMALYYAALHITGDIEKTRTMVMILMCMESLFLALSLRSFRKTIFRMDIFSNPWLTGAIAISFSMVCAAVYIEPLREILSLTPLAWHDWAFILSANIAEILLIDTIKLRFLSGKKRRERLSIGPALQSA